MALAWCVAMGADKLAILDADMRACAAINLWQHLTFANGAMVTKPASPILVRLGIGV